MTKPRLLLVLLIVGFGVVLSLVNLFYAEIKLQMAPNSRFYLNLIMLSNTAKPNASNDQYQNEWTSFKQDFQIRRTGVFYFYNDSLVTLLAITSQVNRNIRLQCLFQVSNRKAYWSKAKLKILGKWNNYIPVAVECRLNKNAIDLETDKIAMGLVDLQTMEKVNLQMSIRTKPVKKKEFCLCVKTLYGEALDSHSLNMWITLNKHIGFEKIEIFNNSMPDKVYRETLAKHKGFVEIKPYHFYPHLHLYDYVNYESGYIRNFVNVSHALKDLNERLSFNECYLSNKYDYDKIAILDPDELILPYSIDRRGSCTQTANRTTNMTDMAYYFKQLGNIDEYKNAASYRFAYEHFIPNPMIDSFMVSLKTAVIQNAQETEIAVSPSKRFRFSLKTKKNYEYAVNLLAKYDKVRSSRQKKKSDNKLFDRMFSVFVDEWENDAKSVHFTDKVQYVHTHHTLFVNYTTIAKQHGSTAHFREQMKIYGSISNYNMKIENIAYNSNYYDCYFLEIGEILISSVGKRSNWTEIKSNAESK
jgi:hypothetical protein